MYDKEEQGCVVEWVGQLQQQEGDQGSMFRNREWLCINKIIVENYPNLYYSPSDACYGANIGCKLTGQAG